MPGRPGRARRSPAGGSRPRPGRPRRSMRSAPRSRGRAGWPRPPARSAARRPPPGPGHGPGHLVVGGRGRARGHGQAEHEGGAGPRVVSTQATTVRLHDPPADGQDPCPSPGSPAAALEPVELAEDPPRSGTGMPGPWSTIQSPTVSPAWRATPRRAGAGVAAGVVEQVGEHLVEADRVDQHRRQLVGHVHVDPLPSTRPGPAHHRADHLGDRALDQVGVERPASMRDMSSRLWTSRVSRSTSVLMVTRNSSCSASLQRTSRSSRLEAEALMEASGVRRSWETELSRAVRSRSVSCRARARLRCSSCWPRSTASAAWLAKVARTAPLGLAEPGGVGAAGDHHQRPDHGRAAAHGHGQGPARLQARPRQARSWIERMSRTPTKRSSRSPGTSPSTAARWRPSPEGSTMAHPARSNRERTVRTTSRSVFQAAVGDQAGREVEQHAGLALAALGLGPAALAGRHQQAHHHGDQQVDGQRQVVLGVVDDGGGRAGGTAGRRRGTRGRRR